jgi:hypothetical protein
VLFDGPSREAVDTYLATAFVGGSAQLPPPDQRPGSGEARVVEVVAGEGPFEPDAPKVIELAVAPGRPGAGDVFVTLDICAADGTVVAHADSRAWGARYRKDEEHRIRIVVQRPWLPEGRYHAHVHLRDSGVVDACEQVWRFDVLPGAPYPEWPGHVALGGSRVITEFTVEAAPATGVGDGERAGRTT